MDIKTALNIIVDRGHLTGEEMSTVMRAIMNGETTSAQTAGFLIALRMKGETIEEMTAAVRVMREFAIPVPLKVHISLTLSAPAVINSTHLIFRQPVRSSWPPPVGKSQNMEIVLYPANLVVRMC